MRDRARTNTGITIGGGRRLPHTREDEVVGGVKVDEEDQRTAEDAQQG